jgi:hypothetical protein
MRTNVTLTTGISWRFIKTVDIFLSFCSGGLTTEGWVYTEEALLWIMLTHLTDDKSSPSSYKMLLGYWELTYNAIQGRISPLYSVRPLGICKAWMMWRSLTARMTWSNLDRAMSLPNGWSINLHMSLGDENPLTTQRHIVYLHSFWQQLQRII